MADPQALDKLRQGAAEWNRWREASGLRSVDLSQASLSRMNLNGCDLRRIDLSGANLAEAQLEYVRLKEAKLTGAILTRADLGGASARKAVFDDVVAEGANFEVSTLRGASFRRAKLAGARFHRSYLRDTDLSGADLSGTAMRFATLEGAVCENADFTNADMRYATLVDANFNGANLSNVQVFGVAAWKVRSDARTRQDLVVGMRADDGGANLRAHDLHTAQLLSLMLDGTGVRRMFDSVNSKVVLVLGSFSPAEKPALDALRTELQAQGYVAIVFDFERPPSHDYAETILTLAGMSRFVVADFTNAKEVRAEVPQVRAAYKRLPIRLVARAHSQLPVTMASTFTAEEIRAVVRYADGDDLVAKVRPAIIVPAETQAARIAASLAEAVEALDGK
jgi:uncharacterized protein YjbI with pentapeptide repeats